jgi:hypothetical protein
MRRAPRLVGLACGLAAALGAAAARAEPGAVRVEAQGGAGAPLGRAGLAIVAQPTPRLAIGVGFGLGDPVAGQTAPSAAAFSRVGLLGAGPLALDLAGGASLAALERAFTIRRPHYADEDFVQRWRPALRLHAGLGASARLGPVVVRAEGGASVRFGGARCIVQNRFSYEWEECQYASGPGYQPPEPSRIAPYAIVSVGFDAGGTDTSSAAGAPAGQQLRLTLEASPLVGTGFSGDGHFTDPGGDARGLAVDYVRRAGSWLRYGIGARYEQVVGETRRGGATGSHELVALPLFVAAAWRGAIPGHELELALGAGPQLGFFSGGTGHGDERLRALGPTVELALTYAYPLGARTDVSLGAAVRVSAVTVLNGTDYFEASGGFHGVVPVRLGLRRRF